MIHSLFRPVHILCLTLLCALLAACQTMPQPSGFSSAQIAVLKSEGFVESEAGWELTMSERLLFPSDQSALQRTQAERIALLARNLRSAGIETARIEGHTDSTGTAAYNLALSRDRAQRVAAAMQAHGMRFTPDQIIGRGESLPLSDNNTPEGRQDNRRVVVIVSPE